MPDDPNRPGEPPRDINGNPVPPPVQKYDLAGNPIPSAGGPPPGQTPYYGTPPTGGAPAWPPPPQLGQYGQAAPGAYGQPGAFGQPGYYPVQVKGGQILTMGILSFICFGVILGPIAFVQGTNALAAIDRGEADPSQRGAASAGRICGLIGGILAVILIIVRSGAIITTLSHGGR